MSATSAFPPHSQCSRERLWIHPDQDKMMQYKTNLVSPDCVYHSRQNTETSTMYSTKRERWISSVNFHQKWEKKKMSRDHVLLVSSTIGSATLQLHSLAIVRNNIFQSVKNVVLGREQHISFLFMFWMFCFVMKKDLKCFPMRNILNNSKPKCRIW